MNPLRAFLSGNLFPVILYRTTSPISGEIKVRRRLGVRELVVGGVTQSAEPGSKERRVWEALVPDGDIRSVLILGFGAGTVANLISAKYPSAKITGVEIDPVVVELGRQYFEWGRETKVHVEDAASFFRNGKKFDWIVVDLYLGQQNPDFTAELKFLVQIKESLNPSGAATFNRIPLFEGKEKTEAFEENLRQVFGYFKLKKVGYNLIYKVSDENSKS